MKIISDATETLLWLSSVNLPDKCFKAFLFSPLSRVYDRSFAMPFVIFAAFDFVPRWGSQAFNVGRAGLCSFFMLRFIRANDFYIYKISLGPPGNIFPRVPGQLNRVAGIGHYAQPQCEIIKSYPVADAVTFVLNIKRKISHGLFNGIYSQINGIFRFGEPFGQGSFPGTGQPRKDKQRWFHFSDFILREIFVHRKLSAPAHRFLFLILPISFLIRA
jgi:hypothetical protein